MSAILPKHFMLNVHMIHLMGQLFLRFLAVEGIVDECLDHTCTISAGMCTCMLGLHKILLTLKLVAMVGDVQSFAPFLAGNNWMVQKNG